MGGFPARLGRRPSPLGSLLGLKLPCAGNPPDFARKTAESDRVRVPTLGGVGNRVLAHAGPKRTGSDRIDAQTEPLPPSLSNVAGHPALGDLLFGRDLVAELGHEQADKVVNVTGAGTEDREVATGRVLDVLGWVEIRIREL